jgi:hypothetical protein
MGASRAAVDKAFSTVDSRRLALLAAFPDLALWLPRVFGS